MNFPANTTPELPNWMITLSVIWLVFIIVFLFALIRNYTLSSKPEKNPYKNETMGLPRGTLRGILTLTLLFFTVMFQIYALFYLENDTRIATFMGAFQVMLAFYFGSKVMHHLSSTEKYKTRDIASAMNSKKDFEDSESVG